MLRSWDASSSNNMCDCIGEKLLFFLHFNISVCDSVVADFIEYLQIRGKGLAL